MALSKADKWLIGVLLAVLVVGIAVLSGGVLLYRALNRQFALPESAEQAPPVDWKKTFLRGEMSRGTWIEETAGKGFVVAARVWDGDWNGSRGDEWTQKIRLLKTGAGGALEWEAEFAANGWGHPVTVRPAAGGGLLCSRHLRFRRR